MAQYTNYKGKNYDKYRYIRFDIGGGDVYEYAVKQDIDLYEALEMAESAARNKAEDLGGVRAVNVLGQVVETQTRSRGKKVTSYEVVPITEEPGRRKVDVRTDEDLAFEKDAGIGAGNVRPGTRVAGGYVQNDGSVGPNLPPPPETQVSSGVPEGVITDNVTGQQFIKDASGTYVPYTGQSSQGTPAGVITDNVTGQQFIMGPNGTYIPYTGQAIGGSATPGTGVGSGLGGGTSTGTGTGVGGSVGTGTTSGLPKEFQDILDSLEEYLDELEKRGEVINPNIEITPERMAEFTRQAEGEINPYYSSQLKLARETLLRSVGYSTDEILRQEQDAENTYKRQFRTLGEDAADVGFALSGIRQRQEGELAQDTQKTLEERRRSLEFNTGSDVRNFAQLYGATELPNFEIAKGPNVLAGESSFSRPGGTRSLYNLDPAIYSGLVGSQEFERRGAVKTRASELEEAFRSNEALKQQRQLTL